jgi:hypothetical protein
MNLSKNQTKKNQTKSAATMTLLLILVLSLSTFIAFLPTASAHDPAWQVPRFAYVVASPNPVGVGQDALIVFWVNTYPPTAEGAYGDRWTNFMIDVTKPDGTTMTLGPFTSDPVGSSWATFKPDQPGTYKIVFSCQDQVITGKNPDGQIYPGKTLDQINGAASVGDNYLGATSDPFYLEVTTANVEPWPEAPLPTEYWTRPVSNMNREWSGLLGNWLGGAAQDNGPTSRFAYGAAVNTPHIMWTKPYTDGGVMDARFGDVGFYTGLSYESFGLSPPIILDGRLYYSWRVPPRYGWYAVDLYTGETLYFQNTTGPVSTALRSDSSGALLVGDLSFGQILNYESPNQHGGLAYLWSTTGPKRNSWIMFDAVTGNQILTVENVSATGTQVYGKDGSILYYNIAGSGNDKRLTIWNTTRAIESFWSDDITSPDYIRNPFWVWRPRLGSVCDGSHGFSLNISIPNVQGGIREVREGNMIVGGNAGSNDGVAIVKGNLWALNLDPQKQGVGSSLWNIEFTPPSSAGNLTVSMGTVDLEDGVFIFSCTQTRQYFGYDLSTGSQIWTTPSIEAFDFYGMTNNIYQGKLFATGYGGVLHAYDIKTGAELWNYTARGVGFECPYGNYPLSIGAIADGKIYLYSTEHSPTMPMWRGSYVRCIDVNNGHEDWKLADFAGNIAIADGYMVTLNLYDNQIYCIGKGPSATTVSATPGVGNAVTIEGTVTDQSVGKPGIPAISDADQEAWMEHVYEQQGMPQNAQGVPVTIYVTDPNGNTNSIGTVVSDVSGTFGMSWTPQTQGFYTITAAFDGSNAYYGSTAVTHLAVGSAPAASPEPTLTVAPTPPSFGPSSTTYYVVTAAIVIVAVIAAIALILRKRK